MLRLRWLIPLAVVLVASLAVACSKSESGVAAGKPLPLAPQGTALRKIQDTSKIVVGVKYDIPTFGYLNPTTNQLEGFDVDIAKAVAKHIFGDPSKIEFKQAVSKDRIPFLEQSVVDIVISTMTINEDRAKQIDFADTYYVAGQSLLVPKDSKIAGLADLKGKTVASVKGSTSEKNIREKAPEATVVLFDTYSEGVAAMDTGRAEAVTTDDIILYGFVKQSPAKYKVVGGQFTIEPYGIGIAKGKPELLAAVNDTISEIKKNGEWAKIYEKNLPGSKAPAPPIADWREIYKQAAANK